MTSPESIVFQDNKIGMLLGEGIPRERAAQDLFECYRISGADKYAFVAALIGRLCLLHTKTASAGTAKSHKETSA